MKPGEIARELREHKNGAHFIRNTGDKAWQRWMRGMLDDLDVAADALDRAEERVKELSSSEKAWQNIANSEAARKNARLALADRLAEAVPGITSSAFPGPTTEDKLRLVDALAKVRAALTAYRDSKEGARE